MKVKLGYNVYTQKEIEIDDKWKKLIEISMKEWGDLTKPLSYDRIDLLKERIDTK